jgi:aspartate beta-hydroxylase
MGKFYDRFTHTVRGIYDRHIDTPPVLDTASMFPGAQRFVDAWPLLQAEAMALAADLQSVPRFHELMVEQMDISAVDGLDWRVYLLKAYGVDIKDNFSKCPTLERLVKADPDVVSASISFLAPHKHIPRHNGPFRGILRFQLSLSMPVDADGRPAVILGIEDQHYGIGSGECLLWDDTYAHEVWSHSDELRVALLLDIRRRGMPRALSLLSNIIIRAIGIGVRVRGVA